MILEQPSELNRYHASQAAGSVWGMYRLLFPTFFVLWLLCSEMNLMALFVGNPAAVNPVLVELFSVPACLVLGPAMMMAAIRLQRRLKRTLIIDRKGLKGPATSFAYVRWEAITAWWLEPVPDLAKFRRLRLLYPPFRGRKRHVGWSMILKTPEQTDLLKAELEQIRQSGVVVPDLRDLHLWQNNSIRPRNPWPLLLGLYLFMHAFIFLMIGFAIRKSDIENPVWTTTGKNDSPLVRFVTHNFSSFEQFQIFLFIAGGCAALVAIICFVWQRRISNRPIPAQAPILQRQ